MTKCVGSLPPALVVLAEVATLPLAVLNAARRRDDSGVRESRCQSLGDGCYGVGHLHDRLCWCRRGDCDLGRTRVDGNRRQSRGRTSGRNGEVVSS